MHLFETTYSKNVYKILNMLGYKIVTQHQPDNA